MGQHGAHLCPVGHRWAPCWPHGPCYLGGQWVTTLIRLTVAVANCCFRSWCQSIKRRRSLHTAGVHLFDIHQSGPRGTRNNITHTLGFSLLRNTEWEVINRCGLTRWGLVGHICGIGLGEMKLEPKFKKNSVMNVHTKIEKIPTFLSINTYSSR